MLDLPEQSDSSPASLEAHKPHGSPLNVDAMVPELDPSSRAPQLDEALRQAYKMALVAGSITLSNYRSITGRSDAASRQDLALLVRLGLLERKGSGRQTLYAPVAQQKSSLADSPQSPAG